MRKSLTALIGPGIYATSVASAVLTVDLLRRASNGANFSNSYIEWTAIALIIAALTDFGIPSSLQWSLLSAKAKPTVREQKVSIRIYLDWLKWAFGGAGIRWRGLLSTALAVLLLLWMTSGKYVDLYAQTLLLILVTGVAINLRKLICAFLDGAQRFKTSRAVAGAPNYLILAHAFLLWTEVLHNNSIENFAIFVAIYYSTSTLIGLALLSSRNIVSRIPDVSSVSQTLSSARDWHLLSVCSVIQSQAFFILAPKLGISDVMIPVYYAQRMVQFSSEMASQLVKEWFSKTRENLYEWPRKSVKLTLQVSLACSVAGLLAFLYGNPPMIPSVVALITLIAIEGFASTFYTCRGHIALMCGQVIPVRLHMMGTLMQPILALVLIPAFGASGHYISTLLSGSIFSYRANNTIYVNAVSNHVGK